jgi:hypothetical protein
MHTARGLRFSFVALLLVLFAAKSASATTITFDSPISTAFGASSAGFGGGVGTQYQSSSIFPWPGFLTQGFTFGTMTDPIAPNVSRELTLLENPGLCLLNLGIACASGNAHYLGFDLPVSLVQPAGMSLANFSILSFTATQIFPAGGCPTCDGGAGIPNATSIRVSGFRGSNLVAQQTFALGQGFTLFSLNNDPDWFNVGRVIFEPLGGLAGIDNLNVEAVPEPASLTLLTTGIVGAGLFVRRRRRA